MKITITIDVPDDTEIVVEKMPRKAPEHAAEPEMPAAERSRVLANARKRRFRERVRLNAERNAGNAEGTFHERSGNVPSVPRALVCVPDSFLDSPLPESPEDAGSTGKNSGISGVLESNFTAESTPRATGNGGTVERFGNVPGNAPGVPSVPPSVPLELTGEPEPRPAKAKRERALIFPPGFTAAWAEYPKKVGKQDAYRAWINGNCESRADEIIAKIQEMRLHDSVWAKGSSWVKDMSGWLNSGGWDDEPRLVAPEPVKLTQRERRDIEVREMFREQGLDPDQILADPLEKRRRVDEIVRDAERGEPIDITPRRYHH